MRISIYLSLVMCIFFAGSALAAEKTQIMRWTDKNGIVHYGDKMPAPSDSTKASVLNKDGVTIKQIDYSPKKEATQDKADIQQARKDAALLGSYNSIEDIEIAKQRNTKIDKNVLKAITEQLNEKQAAQDKQNKTIEAYIADGKQAPKALLAANQKNKAFIKKLKKQIEAKERLIQAIEQRYENDKTDFLTLKSKDIKD